MRKKRIVVLLVAVVLLLGQAAAAHQSVDPESTLIPFHMQVLENGLRVIVKEIPSYPIAVANVWVGVGAKDDPDGLSGMAHFFEHLMFQGHQVGRWGRSGRRQHSWAGISMPRRVWISPSTTLWSLQSTSARPWKSRQMPSGTPCLIRPKLTGSARSFRKKSAWCGSPPNLSAPFVSAGTLRRYQLWQAHSRNFGRSGSSQPHRNTGFLRPLLCTQQYGLGGGGQRGGRGNLCPGPRALRRSGAEALTPTGIHRSADLGEGSAQRRRAAGAAELHPAGPSCSRHVHPGGRGPGAGFRHFGPGRVPPLQAACGKGTGGQQHLRMV